MASAPLPRGRQPFPAVAERAEAGPPSRTVPALRPPPPPRASFPIAIKFAFFIAVLVVLIMVWQTFTAMRVAVESQDIAINESGIRDVCALAAALDPAWIETSDPALRHKLDAALQGYCAASRGLGVLNAMVYSPRNSPLSTGKPGEAGFVVSRDSRAVAFERAAEAGVEIHELEYNRQPVRVFSKEIRADRDGGPVSVGRVEVLLSALRIDQSRDAVRDRMLMVTAAAAAVAALLSFILAAFLTYPIRTLSRDLRQVSLGHFDHQSKVRSGDEIGDLARAFNHMTSNLLQAQETLAAQKAMEHELNLATRIQTRLLPSSIPQVPGLDIAAYYRSAREVGGDYYDFLRIGDEHLGVVVADVSGKGVPGSLVMTMTRALLRMAAAEQTSAAAAIEEVNEVLAPDLSPGMFVTLVYLVLHVPTRRVELVRAGHNAPLLHSAQKGKLLTLHPKGIALGLDPRGPLFHAELEARSFVLQPGDSLFLYTDGIVEGKNQRGECYSDERFGRVVLEEAPGSAQAIIDRVIADLESHRGAAEQSDDITLVVLKSAPAERPSGARPGSARSSIERRGGDPGIIGPRGAVDRLRPA